jgi:hypothetical protein
MLNAVHNIQAQTPTENVLAMVDEFHKCTHYPL